MKARFVPSLLALILWLGAAATYGQNLVSVALQNSDATKLKSNGGLSFLSAGASAAGDGALIQFGYYSAGSSANPFAGTFVPLTGDAAANPAYSNTSVGDTGGGGDGRFSFVTTFTQGSATTGINLPTAGTPLVIRFYDQNATATATFYNDVSSTNANWQWKAPTQSPGSVMAISLDDAGLIWNAGPSSAFQTSIPTVNFNGSQVTLVGANGNPGQQITLPVLLKSQGNENAIGFSLTFDPVKLTYISTTLGSDSTGGILITNSNGAASGQLGIAVSLSGTQTYSVGSRQVATVTFLVNSGALGGVSNVAFSNTPVLQAVSSATAQTLNASFLGGAVTLLGGYEADMSPRPSGNGLITVTDWTQVGRFVAGLDTPTGTEYQRADCAPRSTFGDAKLTVTDWVQAGRYAAGLDPITPAAGPTSATQASPPPQLARLRRSSISPPPVNSQLSVANMTASPGSQVIVPVRLTSNGNENAIGFSLNFDPAKLTFASIVAGTDAGDCQLIPNANNAASGQLGVALSKPFGMSFASGTRELVKVTFSINPGVISATTGITFGATPVAEDTSDPNGNSLTASYTDGQVTVNSGVTFTISTSAVPNASGTASGAGSYSSGSTATVTAIPNPGFQFVNWTEGVNVVSTSASYQFTVSAARALVAHFVTGQFLIATSVAPANTGTTTGDGTYSGGASATVIATANAGNSLLNWTEAGNVVSTSSSYTFAVIGSRTLIANFQTGIPAMRLEYPVGTRLVSGSTVDFGTRLTSASNSQTFTIKNIGSALLSLGTVSFSGASSNDFTITSNPASSVAVGGSTTFTVQFNPTGAGARNAALQIPSNDLNASPVINLAGTGVAAAPAVAVLPATIVSATAATLNGTVNAYYTSTAVSFDYGTSTAYGKNVVASPSPLSNHTADTVSAALKGLVPGSTYHYRVKAINSAGTSLSSDATFTVPSNVATLSGLVLSTGTLSPAFGSATINYTATVPNLTSSIMVTPKVTQGLATVQVNGVSVTSGSPSGAINLGTGGTVITVVVTAQDGTTTKTYTISINGPLLVVQQAGLGLTSGVSSRDFGGVVPTKTASLVFTVKNAGKVALSALALTFDGATPGDFSITSSPATSVASGGSTSFTVRFKPVAVGPRSATLHLASNDLSQNPFDIPLTGTGAAMPAIAAQPVSLIAGLGQPASLTVGANGGALSYQWLKGGVAVAGATSSSYDIAALALTNAGAYTVKATNVAGSAPSLVANLGVVNLAPTTVTVVNGKTITLTVSAAGPGLTYRWQKKGVAMTNGTNPANGASTISGATTPALTITKAVTDDADTYTCLVTMPDPQHAGIPLSLASGVFTVKVTINPVVNAFTPGPWIVSGTVTDVITAQNSPTNYTVTGLPTGVSVNPTTGRLVGKPTVTISAATTYHLTITASNAAGSSAPMNVDVSVQPLQSNAIGTFSGLVDRDATFSSGYGGSFTITSLSTGIFTGKLTVGGLPYSFTAQRLDAAIGASPSATVIIVRTLALHNLTVTFSINKDTGELLGTVTDGVIATPVNVRAWLNPWNATSNPAPMAAIYNSELALNAPLAGTGTTAGNIIYPQGTGFGTLTITGGGVATWSGQMADGAPTTSTTTVGPHGEVPLHFMLYTNTGSAHGWVQASGSDPTLLLDSVGTFDWMKTAQTGSTLNYKDGFPLHNLTVVGAKYIPPTAGSPLVLGIPAVASGTNAKLTISEGGLSALSFAGPPAVSIAAAANVADMTNHGTFRITGPATANAVTLPIPNPATVALSINALTGAFGGSFILHGDQDPTKATPSLINRTATFSGLCVTRSTGSPTLTEGVGYFLLPELQPYPGLSITKSPLLSGQVFLQQDP